MELLYLDDNKQILHRNIMVLLKNAYIDGRCDEIEKQIELEDANKTKRQRRI